MVNREMTMSERIVVRFRIAIDQPLAVLDQPFFSGPQIRGWFCFPGSALLTEIPGDTVREIRMELSVEELEKGIVKYFFESFVSPVPRTKSITMACDDFFSVEVISLRCATDGYAVLGRKIVKNPYVMISDIYIDVILLIFEI